MSEQDKTLKPASTVSSETGLKTAKPTEFTDWQTSLDSARGGATLLDRILSPHDSATLVPKLSVDDLFGYIRRIGLQDAEGVLALASGTQVQGMLDTDGWSRDELQLERLDPWLNALMRAGPEVLGERILDLDDSMVTQLLLSSVKVYVIDEPEDFNAPDVEHVLTPDGRLCICFPESAPRDLPIKIFLDWLVQMKPIYCMNLLVFSAAALESNLVEDAYRWRSARMADRGYVDYYDALKIYVPATKQQIANLTAEQVSLGPVVRHWLAPLSSGSQRLEAALSVVDSDALDHVQSSLAYAMNMALSADRVELWDEEHQEESLQRVRSGLVLGLDAINGPDASPEMDAQTLGSVPVSLIFRVGYGRVLDAAGAARSSSIVRNLRGESGRVGGVDIPHLRPWAEWLTARHPAMPGGDTPSTSGQLNEMTSNAVRLADLARVSGADRDIDVGIAQLVLTRFVGAMLGLQSDGPLPLDQLVNAHAVLIEDGQVPDSTRDAAYLWWLEQGGRQRETVDLLLGEVTEQLGGISQGALEARHIPLLWIIEHS